jgi:hypothetical protein
LRDIYIILFTRFMKSKTDAFTRGFIRLLLVPLAVSKPGYGPDELIATVEQTQAG